MRRIESPVGEIDPDGSGDPVGQEVEGEAPALLVVYRQSDMVPRPRYVDRLGEQMRVDVKRTSIIAGSSLEVRSRTSDLQTEIAIGEVAVHRNAGNRGAGEACLR